MHSFIWPTSIRLDVGWGTVLLTIITIVLFFIKYKDENCRRSRISNRQVLKSDISKLPLPPTPWRLPIIGHLPFLGPLPFVKMNEWAKVYGEIFQIYLGPKRAVVINGGDLIRDILVHKGNDVAGRPDFPSFKMVNNGEGMIFNSPSKQWHIKRTLLQRSIATYLTNGGREMALLLTGHARHMANSFLSNGGKSLDPRSVIWNHSSIFFHQILIANPGVSKEKREHEINELVCLFEEILKYSSITMLTDLFPILHMLFKKQIRQFRQINSIITNTIFTQQHSSLNTYEPGVVRDITDGIFAAHKSMSSVDLSLADLDGPQGQLKALQLIGDLVGAGQSTVALSLRWLLLHVAVFPDVQAKIHAELATLGHPDQDSLENALLCEEDDKILPYTCAAILESRRHACLFPLLVPHATTRDTELGGYFVPADTVLLFNVWSASRDTRVWGNDPEAFVPERFIDPATGLIDRQSRQNILSFGAGRRNCIGEKIGSTAVFIIFVELLRRCRFSLPPAPKPPLMGIFGFDLEPSAYKLFVEPV